MTDRLKDIQTDKQKYRWTDIQTDIELLKILLLVLIVQKPLLHFSLFWLDILKKKFPFSNRNLINKNSFAGKEGTG
jgi:hypothetical protein